VYLSISVESVNNTKEKSKNQELLKAAMAELYFGAALASGVVAYAYVLPENIENGIMKGSRIVAEYTALIKGLKRALDADITKLTVFGPKLPVDQLNGVVPVKSSKALPLHSEAKDLLSKFRKIELNAVPQKRNKAFSISVQALVEFFEGKAIARSREILDKNIRRVESLKFDVDGYVVDLGSETCNCPFFVKTNSSDVRKAGVVVRCQHIFAAEKFISRLKL